MTSAQTTFTCPATGRYEDPDSTDCTSYYLCTRDASGNLLASYFTCVDGTTFNPNSRQCELGYVCTIVTTSTTEPVTNTTEAPAFTCEATGRFPDPESVNCTTYYLCSRDQNGDFLKTKFTCPAGRFNPDTADCTTDDFVCETEPTTTTTPAPICINNFVCDSLTTFRLCYNGTPIDDTPNDCNGYICYEQCTQPCVLDATLC